MLENLNVKFAFAPSFAQEEVRLELHTLLSVLFLPAYFIFYEMVGLVYNTSK